MKNVLPELKIYTNDSDVKFVLFEQGDVISDQIRTMGNWNSHVLTFVDKILNKQLAGTVIDIGAGLGAFSIPLACTHNQRFHFKSFEPLKIIFMQLASNVLLNNLDNVRIHNVALGNQEKRMTFNTIDLFTNANHGSFSFNEEINKVRNIVPTDKKEVYEFRKLDSYGFDSVRFIKLSAPGMELEVLQGAKQTIINSDKPPILFETWDAEWYKDQVVEIFNFLQEMQYSHFASLNGYQVAFKSEAQYDFFMSDDEVVESGDFIISEKVHDTEETLKDQKVYNP